MVIQHNMSSLNTRRQLKKTVGGIAKSSEKLSSGYKINRAADNAAGLCISEKMRGQIRGLRRASQNIEDGVSLCQVADGALNETVDVLQRMRELAVQSANGTNSEGDRQSIEIEIVQLRHEIDRIARETKFNDAIYPLNAPVTYTAVAGTEDSNSPPGVPAPGTPPAYGPNEGIIREKTITFFTNKECTYDGIKYNVGDKITVTGLTTNGSEVWVNGGLAYAAGAWSNQNSEGSLFADNMKTLEKADLKFDNNGYIYYVDMSGGMRYAVYVTDPSHLSPPGGTTGNPDPIHFESSVSADKKIKDGWARYMKVDDLTDKNTNPPKPSDPDSPAAPVGGYYSFVSNPVIIHAGDRAHCSNQILIYTVSATCEGLGITDVTAAAQDSAAQAIGLIDNAINRATAYRSAFGAMQNRLEHAKSINDNTSENVQSAESKIRDVDMAVEMVQYSGMCILAQAGQSMLAQANQSSQSVLNLIAWF